MATTPAPSLTVFLPTGTATGPFATGWKYNAAEDVAAYLELDGERQPDLTQGDDFTVTGATPTVDGGTVTLDAGAVPEDGWATGDRLVLYRRTVKRQALQLADTEGHKPQATEKALDRLTRSAEEVADGLASALKFPPAEIGLTLARAPKRAGTIFVWSGDGTAIRTDVTYGQLAADAAALVTAPALSQIDTAKVAALTAITTQQTTSVAAVVTQEGLSITAVEGAETAALSAIGTAGDNELIAIGAAGDAEEASITALAATKKADILTTVPSQGPYAYAHASALPRGITGVTSLVGGSGGTNGTFALGVSGGDFTGVVGEFTVAGGVVTGVVFTNGGINLTGGTTVPTLSFAASAGLTGASATAVASPKVATQGTYLAASADGKALYLWRNDGTSTPAAVLDANGYQVAYISKSGFDAVFDQTVPPESGWTSVFTDKDGLVMGGFDADGVFRFVRGVLPALATFTDDDLLTPLGSRVIPGGAGISLVRAYDESGYALAVTDANDLVLWGVSNLPRPRYVKVTTSGDSLSAQASAKRRQVMPDREHTDLTAGGRTSTELAALAGGVPALLTASSNTIQASGSTTVSASSVSIITNQGAQSVAGTWGGVAGTLTATGFDGNGRATGFSFARATAGQALTIPANTPFLPDLARDHQSDVWIIDWGRNDGAAAFASGATEANIEAQVKFLGHDRFLIRAVTDRGIAYEAAGSSDYAALMGMLNRLQARFGPRFVDLHRGMVDRGLTIAGLTPTADDNTDIAADVIPRQLKLSEGGGTIFTHFTDAGYFAREVLTKEAIDRMGW